MVLELPEVTWARDLRSPSNGGLVTGMRFGLFKPGLSRVVLDSAVPVRIVKAFTIHPTARGRPHRVVLDLARTTKNAFMQTYLRTYNASEAV